jgi:stage II sporulation protein D
VIARTYAVAHMGRHATGGYDVCDGTHCQLYQPSRIATSRFTPVARQALVRTRGEVLTFAGRPADALFHSDCGGHTAPSTTAWGGLPVPYLAGREDDVPQGTHRAWEFTVNNAALRNALNSDARSTVGSRLDTLTVVERDETGRAVRVELKGERRQLLRAEQLRAILTAKLGDRTIQSTRFTVKETGSRWQFSGTGFGHGVGLCQVGAAARARRGESLAGILRTYYPGTKLVAS